MAPALFSRQDADFPRVWGGAAAGGEAGGPTSRIGEIFAAFKCKSVLRMVSRQLLLTQSQTNRLGANKRRAPFSPCAGCSGRIHVLISSSDNSCVNAETQFCQRAVIIFMYLCWCFGEFVGVEKAGSLYQSFCRSQPRRINTLLRCANHLFFPFLLFLVVSKTRQFVMSLPWIDCGESLENLGMFQGAVSENAFPRAALQEMSGRWGAPRLIGTTG